jgi:hypothetical protein
VLFRNLCSSRVREEFPVPMSGFGISQNRRLTLAVASPWNTPSTRAKSSDSPRIWSEPGGQDSGQRLSKWDLKH